MRSITLLRCAGAELRIKSALPFRSKKARLLAWRFGHRVVLATGFQKLNLRSMRHLLRGLPQTILSIYCCISSPVCVLHIESHALDPFLFNAFISIPQPFQIYPPLKCLTSGL